ncbi:Sel1 domain protein repeat-containing protein, partial [mine drainage metagenome]
QLGQGVPRSSTEALHWFRRSAIEGSHSGQLILGLRYAAGKGVKQSYRVAFAWVALSAEPPGPARFAPQVAKVLASHLTRAQIEMDVRIIRSWRVGQDIK